MFVIVRMRAVLLCTCVLIILLLQNKILSGKKHKDVIANTFKIIMRGILIIFGEGVCGQIESATH